MLDIAAIHLLYKMELRKTYTTLQIIVEGTSSIDDPPPRMSYLMLSGGASPRQSLVKKYSDPEGVPTTDYTDFVYDKYRYNLIVSDSAGTENKSPLQLLKEVSKMFLEYLRSDEFVDSLEDIGIRHTLLTGIKEAIVSRSPFFERRNYIDIQYGHNDNWTRQEGSFIETVNYDRTKPPEGN